MQMEMNSDHWTDAETLELPNVYATDAMQCDF